MKGLLTKPVIIMDPELFKIFADIRGYDLDSRINKECQARFQRYV